MPLYYFALKNGRQFLTDPEGEEFPDLDTARSHAEHTARELMHNRELKTRFWRIEVLDDYLNPLVSVHFAAVDQSICHLPAEWREAITNLAQKFGRLTDSICQVEATIADVKKTLAEAERWIPGSRSNNNT